MTNHTFTIDSPTGHLCQRISDDKTWPAEILKSNAKGLHPIKALADFGSVENVLEFLADGTKPYYRLINAPAKLTVEELAKEARNAWVESRLKPFMSDWQAAIRHVLTCLGHTINEDGTIEVAK